MWKLTSFECICYCFIFLYQQITGIHNFHGRGETGEKLGIELILAKLEWSLSFDWAWPFIFCWISYCTRKTNMFSFNIPLKNKVKHVFFNKLNFRQHTTPPPQRRKMFCWHYVVSEVYSFQLESLSSCCKHCQAQFQFQPQCLPVGRVVYVFTCR